MKLMRGRVAPLAVVVFVLAFAAGCAVVAASASLLRATGHVEVPMWQALIAGAPASLVIATIAMLANVQASRAMQRIQSRARTVEALQRRVRIADEVAERHRRSAETASAGMFELLSGLVAAEEGARGQLAAELHDTVAQSLTTAQVLLNDEDMVSIRRARDMISEAEEQVRAVMARTRPPALREGDLARAVSSLRDDLRNRYGLEVDLSWPAEAYPLPLVTAVTTYRFFQEGLLNVVKHADVDAARAQLWVDDDWVVATVVDGGMGFDPATVHSEGGRHVGLGLLRERARLVGGSLDVSSTPVRGTTLTLRLPRAGSGANGVMPVKATLPPIGVTERVG
ncbi:MAG TPA: sensor histidine kinase [Mycobacteriales bacterium]|nr:sensor histidine kinase [Mycobacteriales bacterium]